ncbi:farnesyl pyrophosphate synthase1 [Zea mays]|uniref:Farnesyl pyrophosphate synthase1 n=1 Tax=Zea mays TaxID=4577 RepID=A0A1D6FJF0_MAIZE|nr:farnesyl pyrophosphate synthase1 [Zea mays]
MAAGGNGAGGDTRAAFARIYKTLKEELLTDPAFEFTEESRQWIDRVTIPLSLSLAVAVPSFLPFSVPVSWLDPCGVRRAVRGLPVPSVTVAQPGSMVDYNVLGGKCNRGLSVVDSYKLLKGADALGEEETFLACTLGWCIEWLQAFFLVLDDIMDDSHTRRGQPCWFRVPQVGLIAANDGIILRNHISRILRRHFKGKPYYADLLDLFNEVEFKTASGQLLDLITTHEGEKDLTKYNITVHGRIVQYKTAYYSFYLPVACALLLSGENLDNYGDVENILVEMGTYFQVQDDYLDCYGDPEFIGKIGTDIEDYKCSWLVVQALERADESQKRILFENYGKKDPACVAKVKNLYKELDLEAVFQEYENESYKKLIADIEAQPSIAVQKVLKSFLHKIYKRQK